MYLLPALAIAFLVLSGQSCVSLTDSSTPQTSGPAGVFLSTDRGTTWKPISAMPTIEGVKQLTGTSVYRLFEDPQDPAALYWASRSDGLFYSYDGGKSWLHSGDPFATGFVYSVAVHPKQKCTIYATNGRQVFASTDCLRSWKEVYQELRTTVTITSLAFDPSDPYHIFVTESNGDIVKSEDSGVHWNNVSRLGVELRELFFDPNTPGLAYAASKDKGLFRSRDHGNTWENLKANLTKYSGSLTYRRFLLYPKSQQIYWISQYGILVSYDSGDTWTDFKLITPPGSVNIYGFGVNPLNDKEIYYIGTIDVKSTFYRSKDGGKTWETKKLPSKQIPSIMRIHPEHGDWIYLGYTIPPKQ